MISAVILTKNSQKTLLPLLQALVDFDVVVYDTGSEDRTLAIARGFANVQIYQENFSQNTFPGFGILKNRAIAKAKNDWIFLIDSDELPSKDLITFLKKESLSSKYVYTIPRHNFYNGKRIFGCGWDPDIIVRIFNRQKTRVSDDLVHEKIEQKNCKIKHIPYAIEHVSYLCINDFLKKMQHYSTLFAEERKNSRISFSKALFHSVFAFFKSYVLKRGILDGKEGLIISWYNASVAFVKYLKIWERNQKTALRNCPFQDETK